MVRPQKGFTLIELMIVIGIIGILAAVAVPQYTKYNKRAKFSEVVLATAAFKSTAEIAYQTGRAGPDSGAIAALSAGVLGIPENIPSGGAVGAHVDSVSMLGGLITAVGAASVDNKTFTIQAAISNDGLTWTKGGSCYESGLC